MLLILEPDTQAGVLVARISGERPALDGEALETFTEMWRRVSSYCQEHGLHRVLALASIAGSSSSSVTLRFYLQLESCGFDRSIRTAIVFATPWRRGVNQIGINAATERGWDIKAFDEEAEARKWLGI